MFTAFVAAFGVLFLTAPGLALLVLLVIVTSVASVLWYRRTLKRNPAKIAELEAQAAKFIAERDAVRERLNKVMDKL